MTKTPSHVNLPVWSLLSAVALVGLGIVGLATIDLDKDSTPIYMMFVGLIVTTVPSLISAAYAERTSRDIRNGTVTEKLAEALDKTGVTEAITNGSTDTDTKPPTTDPMAKA